MENTTEQKQQLTADQQKAVFMHEQFMEAMNRIHEKYPDVLTPELSNAMLMLSIAMNNGIIEGHKAQIQAQSQPQAQTEEA
jgi:hypothetical protein